MQYLFFNYILRSLSGALKTQVNIFHG